MFRGKKNDLGTLISFSFPYNASQPINPVMFVHPQSHVDAKIYNCPQVAMYFLEL